MPPDIIDTLFNPFVTTKSHGLGIGLTIVASILNAHAGTIAAHNNPEGRDIRCHALRSETPVSVRVVRRSMTGVVRATVVAGPLAWFRDILDCASMLFGVCRCAQNRS